MQPARHRPDDDIRRVRNVWLGPRGITLPFTASYVTWGIWFVTFMALLLLRWVSPIDIGNALWDMVLAGYVAVLVSKALDHDRPLRMLFRVIKQHLTSPRHTPQTRLYSPARRRVRIKETL